MSAQQLDPWQWHGWLRAKPGKLVPISAPTRHAALRAAAFKLGALIHHQFGTDPDIAAVDAEVVRGNGKAAV